MGKVSCTREMCVSGIVFLMGEGRTDVGTEARCGHPFVMTEDFKGRKDAHFRENSRLTTDKLHEVSPYDSRSILYENVRVQLRYR
jgi:hypothetical protein